MVRAAYPPNAARPQKADAEGSKTGLPYGKPTSDGSRILSGKMDEANAGSDSTEYKEERNIGDDIPY